MNNLSTPNKLINETSPYLLQHAYNPVEWYPWGTEALEKAKVENKVILVSIGYSACHWCHVMERESFEDVATAAVMNENFVCIKIDREERPDLDHIYMDAVQAMTGSGGWPLNVFLTPGAKPFYGGTYFPPVNAFNRSSWTDVLQGVASAWRDRREEILSQAENLTSHIGNTGMFRYDPVKLEGVSHGDVFPWGDGEQAFVNIMKTADTVWGGFGRAPKFPQTFSIAFLLQYHHYTGNQQALAQAILSLDKMLQGGIYDHVGGGLARYSTDNEWLAPHFEKMLYDNALLVNVLCDAFVVTKQPRFQKAIEKTIDFVLKELSNEEGGFYAALDADSEGEEGRYYVWQKEEVDALLNENADLFCRYFDITTEGNWEEKNIPRVLTPLPEFSAANNLAEGELERTLDDCLNTLYIARNKRVRPGLDDKCILGWNALMLKAITSAAVVLQNETYLKAALTNFEFINNRLLVNNGSAEMLHTWKNPAAKYPAFLDDYAYYIEACINLYQATFLTDFLEKAKQTCHYVCIHFSDDDDVFFYYTRSDQDDVIVRKKEMYDNAIPSGNSVMARNLLSLSIIFDNAAWRERAIKMLQSAHKLAVKYPGSFGVWASLIAGVSKGWYELAVTGDTAPALAKELLRNYFLPNSVIMASKTLDETFALLAGKSFNEPNQIYLCRNYICNEPVADLNAFAKLAQQK